MAMLGVIFSGISPLAVARVWPERGAVGFSSSIVVDPFFLFFGMIFLIATALVILLSVRYLQIEDENHGEYYALLLFATVGMMFMASGYDLIVQFLGLETMAISFYVLAGFLRRDSAFERRRGEISAAGRVQLGDCWPTDSRCCTASAPWPTSAARWALPLHVPRTNLDVMRAALELRGHDGSAGASGARHGRRGAFLQGGGRAVPPVGAGRVRRRAHADHGVHQRGVEDGQLRAAAAAVPLRVSGRCAWTGSMLIAGVAIASLTIGNFAAITQTNVKRMLAYSSISHVGYILLGMVAAASSDRRAFMTGMKGVAFYLFVYALHDHRRVRRRHRAAAAGTDRRRTRRPERPDPAQPGGRGAAADFHAVARGDSAAGGLCREVFHLAGADSRPATTTWRFSARSTSFRRCTTTSASSRTRVCTSRATRRRRSSRSGRRSRSPRCAS